MYVGNVGFKRNVTVDIAKGIGIILMVIGHSSVPDNIRHSIYIFHMPLFFVIAGCLFNYERWKGKLWAFSKKKAERLIIPYLLMSIFIFFPIWFVASLKFPQFATHDIAEPINVFVDIFYATFVGNGMAFNSPLWFLPCLFVTEIIFWVVLSVANNNVKRWGIVCILSLVGFYIRRLELPWSFDVALVVLVFMMMGYQLRLTCVGIRYLPGLLLVLFLVNEANSVDIAHRAYGNMMYFYVGGAAGTLVILQISKIICDSVQCISKLIAYLGEQSMAILMWHGWCLKMISAFIAYIIHLSFSNTKAMLWPFVCFCAILLSLIILWVKNIFQKKLNDKSMIYKMLEW